jgi:peptidyl-tRNA hydrolase
MKKMYIAVLDAVPDFMVPTLVAHSVINAHINMKDDPAYIDWLDTSFKKVVLRVNEKEFEKISQLPCWLGHENTTLDARKSCAVVLPIEDDERPNVLKFAKMWKPL